MGISVIELAIIVGGFAVAAIVVWSIFSVARAAGRFDGSALQTSVAAELAENQRQLLRAQQEAAEMLAELRGSVSRIEAMLKEVG
jgi:hypothetical protein